MVADCEPSVCLVSTNVSDFKLSVFPVSVKKSKPELSVLSSENMNAIHICPVYLITAMEAFTGVSACPVNHVIVEETINEQSTHPVSVNGLTSELSVCPVSANESDHELPNYLVSVNNPDFEPCFSQ